MGPGSRSEDKLVVFHCLESRNGPRANVLGYYRNLGSLRYGTSTASCKDAYGKMPFFS